MKTLLLALCLAFSAPPASVYDFKLTGIDPSTQIDLSKYRGKKILVVNTACNSAYTYQLEGLQQLYSAYKEKMVVVAVPCGEDFGQQELKTNSDIRYFCRTNYGATFPIAEKTTAIGTLRHPLFSYLIEEAKKMGYDDPVIKWNFTKFLLDENGQLLKVFPADVTPLSPQVTSMLNNDRGWSLH